MPDTSQFSTLDPRTKQDRYLKLKQALWTERSSFDQHWQDIADFLLPRRVRFQRTDRNRGDKRNQNIIDSTGRFALNTLRSGMHAGLTSPARPWLRLTTPDPSLAKFPPVRAWLQEVTDRLLAVFATTNLYNALPVIYGDMGLFGTGAMAILGDSHDVFRAYQYPVGSYALGLNRRGTITTFVREYELTVRQLVEEFGVLEDRRTIDWTHISIATRRLWDNGDYEQPVSVCWIVMPNEETDRGRLSSRYLPFTSCYLEVGAESGKFLKQSGFETFPVLAPRWDVTSAEDSYATDCPGMTALGDVRQLQVMQKDKLRAVKKLIDPPVQGPTALRTQKTSLLPGDITYVDTREPHGGLRAVHEVTLNLEHLRADIEDVRFLIRRAFFEDLFLMLAFSDPSRGQQPITAREVEERHEEKLLALGPTVDRANDELLDPLIDRVYALMDRRGLIPPAPEALEGVDIKAEYTSIMAQAQKSIGVASLDRFVGSIGLLGEVALKAPIVTPKLKLFEIVQGYGDMLGVDPRFLATNDEAQAIVDAQNAQQQQLADAAAAKDMASAAQAAGNTPMGTDSALDRLVAGAAGGA